MQPSNFVKLSLAAAALAPSLGAQTLQADRIITGVSSPIWVGSAPTDDRIWVAEQTQHDIQVYTNDGAFLGLAIDLTGTASGNGERGLLSMAFDPDFSANGYVYVYYTYGGSGSRIARYTVDGTNPNALDPSSALTIIEQSQPFTNHNGGNLLFGPDGYLYFGWGDGGSGGDPGCRAQDLSTLLGKMIRIDVTTDDFPADPNRNYGIPAGNPFVGVAGALPEIYHLGLRNPWRWSFDPHTGDMYIGDVGQNSWEEVSFAPAGAAGLNFGWKIMEGDACFSTAGCTPGTFPLCNDPSFTDPIHTYSLSGTPCAVVGGVVYRGCAIPELYGEYFFADACDSGTYNDLWSFQYDPVGGLTGLTQREAELQSAFSVSSVRSFGYDHKGEILIADANEVFRIIETSRSFTPDQCEISVASGGTQAWTLDAGVGSGGSLYFVGGSLTGIAGIPAGSVTVPLTLDAYTLLSLSKPNQAPLINTFASLDGAGTGNASFSIPGGILPGSIIGTRAFHAYVTLDGALQANFASNPVSVDFLP